MADTCNAPGNRTCPPKPCWGRTGAAANRCKRSVLALPSREEVKRDASPTPPCRRPILNPTTSRGAPLQKNCLIPAPSDASFLPQSRRRGCSSVGRALPCQGRCREFEPRHPLHSLKADRRTIQQITCNRLESPVPDERHYFLARRFSPGPAVYLLLDLRQLLRQVVNNLPDLKSETCTFLWSSPATAQRFKQTPTKAIQINHCPTIRLYTCSTRS